jgi:hypothetical protein
MAEVTHSGLVRLFGIAYRLYPLTTVAEAITLSICP